MTTKGFIPKRKSKYENPFVAVVILPGPALAGLASNAKREQSNITVLPTLDGVAAVAPGEMPVSVCRLAGRKGKPRALLTPAQRAEGEPLSARRPQSLAL